MLTWHVLVCRCALKTVWPLVFRTIIGALYTDFVNESECCCHQVILGTKYHFSALEHVHQA